jgi:hypothetical protein
MGVFELRKSKPPSSTVGIFVYIKHITVVAACAKLINLEFFNAGNTTNLRTHIRTQHVTEYTEIDKLHNQEVAEKKIRLSKDSEPNASTAGATMQKT